jgi:predicted O-methyltransferase YrrM
MAGRNFTLLEDFDEYAVEKVADNSLDFVYIDSDHSYDFVMLDIIKWGRKVKKGGIISGHDYFYDKNTSGRRAKVTQAVNDYANVHGIKFYITDENHFVGRSKNNSDYYPSWFFVKEDDIWPNVVGF